MITIKKPNFDLIPNEEERKKAQLRNINEKLKDVSFINDYILGNLSEEDYNLKMQERKELLNQKEEIEKELNEILFK